MNFGDSILSVIINYHKEFKAAQKLQINDKIE